MPEDGGFLWEHRHHQTRYSKMLIQLNVAISLLALVNEWEILQTTMWSNRVASAECAAFICASECLVKTRMEDAVTAMIDAVLALPVKKASSPATAPLRNWASRTVWRHLRLNSWEVNHKRVHRIWKKGIATPAQIRQAASLEAPIKERGGWISAVGIIYGSTILFSTKPKG